MKITEHRAAYIKADAEGKVKILAKTYGLPAHQIWKHKQSGKYIIKHAGVQTIAAVEGIIVEYATETLTPELFVIKATPIIGGKPGQSTFGEASPKNTQQQYPVAMAEKRGFDRAVLISALQDVGGYGADFYGEDETDSMAEKRNDTVPTEDEMGDNPGPLPKNHTKKADIPTADPKTLSRAHLKARMKGDNIHGINLFDRMYDLEKEAWAQSWKNADQGGLASLAESVENRVAKEG